MTSLWKVSDAGTAALMAEIYRAMEKDSLPPAATLRAAQIEMWQQKLWRDPYYWAAFQLQVSESKRSMSEEMPVSHISGWPGYSNRTYHARPTGTFSILLIWSTLFQLQWLCIFYLRLTNPDVLGCQSAC